MTLRSARALLSSWAAAAVLVAGLALAVAPAGHAAVAPDSAPPDSAAFPAPVGFVNDTAHLLDDTTHARLEALLDQLRRKTGAEFALLTVPTTAPMDPSEYKVEVFRRWGLGQKGKDNGLLLLVAVQEHDIHFETGYGLEGTLPDGLEARIVREDMVPRFRAGDMAGGIVVGVQQAAARIAAESGDTLTYDGAELRYDDSGSGGGGGERGGLGPGVAAILIFIVIVILQIIVRRRRGGGWGGGMGGWGGMGGMGGWGGGFGGFGGGGFGGGGGGGFGGFGGGASGGGGGGGKW